jgi:hypothetical protein
VFSAATGVVAAQFHVSPIVATLGTSLFVLVNSNFLRMHLIMCLKLRLYTGLRWCVPAISPRSLHPRTSDFLRLSVGPMIWGPLSEFQGRKLPLVFSYACFAIFQIPVAVAQKSVALLVYSQTKIDLAVLTRTQPTNDHDLQILWRGLCFGTSGHCSWRSVRLLERTCIVHLGRDRPLIERATCSLHNAVAPTLFLLWRLSVGPPCLSFGFFFCVFLYH